jgi:two-component system nitrogen regulation sensor histidine kinase GlnL
MKELMFSTDPALRISSWGAEIAKITGRSAESVIGSSYSEVLPAILVDGKDALREAARLKEPLELKSHRFNCLFSGLTTDIRISPKLSLEKELEELVITLALTSTCAVEAKLNQSQQLINIGKIASSLAHGVRNPLNAIKGAVVYLNEKYADDPSLIEFMRIMEEEISRLETFISRFLSSSVSEADATDLDVNAVLNKVALMTSMQMQTRNIAPVYELGDTPLITIPSFHFEQTVLNVINNAVDAMGSGGKLVVRTYTANRNDDTFAVIEISDTGPGIIDVKRHPDAPQSTESGRGFGLFITCEILKHYHGHLEIDSKKGSGTTVKMSFPAYRPKVSAPC